MTLGKKLKALRAEHSLSQPELAEKIGIEQSYLSKLENDKSIPSNEIFNNILTAFGLTLEQFVSEIKRNEELVRLKQIPDVALYLSSKQKQNQNNHRRFLYVSSLMIVIATTFIYVGHSQQFFSGDRYYYNSLGVVLDDEPDGIFDSWSRFATDKIERKQLEMKIADRRAEHVLIITENRGKVFVEKIEGGRRQYHFQSKEPFSNPINAWFKVLGVLLMSAGIMGFVLETRLFKYSL
jgi:transcriptional regulator with XRE-family HTH domain